MSEVRCRFAPAPSGFLHVGGAHTALFSWLYARHHGGSFVVRIEDTDERRVSQGAVEAIMSSLSWLGVDWDEGLDKGGRYGPYVQSQRLDLYRRMAEQLEAGGHAYPCFCTPQELEERRKAALASSLKKRGMIMRTILAAAVACTFATSAYGLTYEEKQPACLACHGENGISETPITG